MRGGFWWSSVLFLLLSYGGWGQCPNRRSFALEVEKTQEVEMNNAAIGQLKTWQKKWNTCYSPSDSTYARLVHLLGRRYWLLGQETHQEADFRTAEKYTHQAIKINSLPSPAASRANLVNSFLNLGILNYDHLNQQEKSVDYFTKSVQIARQFPYKLTLASEAGLYLAKYYGSKGDYVKALEWTTSAFEMAHIAKDSYFEVWALNEKIRYLMLLQKWDEAKVTLQNQIKIIETSHQPEYLGLSFLRLAELARQQKKFVEMNQWYAKAIGIYQNQKDTLQIATTLNNWGYGLMKDAKDYVLAQKKLEAALKIRQAIQSKARTLDNLGYLKKEQKRYGEALLYFQKAVEVLIPNLKTLSAKSIKNVTKRDYLFDIIQDKADTWLDYSKASDAPKGALQNALRTYALADSMIDFMRYEHAGEGSKLFWRQKTRGMYEHAIEAAYLAGDTEQGFRFFEKSKAVLLADKLNELGANQQLSEVDTKRQRALRDSIANLQNQLTALSLDNKKRTALQSRLERFNDDFEVFRKNLETTNPVYYRYKYDNSTPTITQFKLALNPSAKIEDKNAAFISYFVGDSAVYAFTLTAQAAKLVKLNISPETYLATTNEFLNLCANRAALNGQYPRYRALAYALYEQLWKPLNVVAARVVVSQDGVFLPLEALLSQPDGNVFLLNKYAISYTYSANFLVKKPPTPQRLPFRWGMSSFVGFAPETFAPALKQISLRGSKTTLEVVDQFFSFGKIFTDAEASKSNFLRYAPDARVIQLFTHADANNTDSSTLDATEPKIYFQDAVLRLSDFNQTDRFRAELLVLSACKTGIGQNQRGEGVFSLARGFAALGIPSIVTTLWNVEDQPTYTLTKLFYKYLAQNLPKDVALQKAKLDWIETGGTAQALPSQWAGMILVGDASALSLHSSTQFTIYGLVLLSLVILGGIWWRRKSRVITPR